MTRILSLIALLSLLSACASAPAIIAGASLVTLAYKDKTVPDYAASWATEKDCSIIHAAYEDAYCKEPDGEAAPGDGQAAEAESRTQLTHCYRTLGEVTCYREPDLMASSTARVP